MVNKILKISAIKKYIKNEYYNPYSRPINNTTDIVTISDKGLIFSKIYNDTCINPKINDLKKSIDNGTYNININNIVNNIIYMF